MGLTKDTLDAVRRVLATQPSNRTPLEARFDGDPDDPSLDSEIGLFAGADGRRHLVHIQVGANYVCINTAIFETKPVDGFKLVSHVASRQGGPRRSPMSDFEAELHRALDASPDAFEPTAGPGVGMHPLTELVLGQATIAMHEYNSPRTDDDRIRLALNADGALGDDDVVTFVRRDGTAMDVQVRTMPVGVCLHNTRTGETLPEPDAERAREMLADQILVYISEEDMMSPRH